MLDTRTYEQVSQRYADAAVRLDLVNRFNYLVGAPSPVVAAQQREFVTGHMTPFDLEAFVRLYEYTIDAVESARRP